MADDLPVLLANYHGIPSAPGEAARRRPRRGAAPAASPSATRPAPGWSTRRPAPIAAAVAVARDADAVIAFVGLDPRLEGEERGTRFNPGGDRRDLDLPAAQRELVEALLATGKPVIVVLTGGSALAVPWLAARAAAVLYAWYPGAEGGTRGRRRPVRRRQPGRPPARSRSTARPPICRRSPTTRCAGAPTATSRASRCTASATGCRTRRSATPRLAPSRARYAAAAVEIENAGIARRATRSSQLYVIPRNAAGLRARAAGWPGSRASRSSRASGASSRSRSGPTR